MKRLAYIALALAAAAAGCGDDDDDGTTATAVEKVTVGSGLTGGGMGPTVNVAVDFTAVAKSTHTHSWTELTGVPTGATPGATCSGTQKVTGIDVSTGKVTCAADVDTTGTDTLGALSCADGKVAKRAGGAWVCGDDLVGSGGDGDTLGALSCAEGNVPKRMGGAWVCGTDLTGGGGDTFWEAAGPAGTDIRFDGQVGIGADPAEALTIQSASAQLALRDTAGQNGAALLLDDADGNGAILNINFQRAHETQSTIFLSAAPANFLTYQSGSIHRFKVPSGAAMLIDNTGRVGIGTEAPTAKLEVSDGTGPNATCDGNTWINASSRTAKEGIKTFVSDDYARVRRWLEETDVVWYRYRDDKDPRTRVGLIAEDVPQVLATADRKGISTADAIGFLTAAAKELATENTRLKSENAVLETRLLKLEARMERMEAGGGGGRGGR